MVRRVPIIIARTPPFENLGLLTGAPWPPFHRSIVRPWVPFGCSVQIRGDMSAHWNSGSGTNDGGYKAVGSQNPAVRKAMRPNEERYLPPDGRWTSAEFAYLHRTFENPGPVWFLPSKTVSQRTKQNTHRPVAMAGARMSSTYGSIYAADNCLKDSGSGLGASGSMCHSAGGESNPWWAADTKDGMTYQIEFVVVRNRADCCWDRFRGYVVTVDGKECARGDAGGQPGFLWIPCSARGSTVRLQLLGNDYLNLQYVGVEGKDPKPKPGPPPAPAGARIAMGNAKLSSDFSPTSNPLPYPAKNCLVDSAENSSMCVSNSQPNPSWTARTADDQQYDISAVIVRNRADCLGTRAAIRAIVFHKLDSLPVRTKC